MDTLTGIWSALVPALISDNSGLSAMGRVLVTYSTGQRHFSINFMVVRLPIAVPSYNWVIDLNQVYDLPNDTLVLVSKHGLRIRVRASSIQLFLESVELLPTLGSEVTFGPEDLQYGT